MSTVPDANPVQAIFEQMRKGMGHVPPAIEKSALVDPGLLVEHMRMRAYTLPVDGALDEHTRTLVYLAAALAGTSPACVQAMTAKAVRQGIPAAKVLEVVHIARFAMASRIIGDAEPIFDALAGQAG